MKVGPVPLPEHHPDRMNHEVQVALVPDGLLRHDLLASTRRGGGVGTRQLGGGPGGSVNARSLRAACLSLTGTVETFPFGPENSVFKVAGRIFALSRLSQHPLRVSLKCEPALAEQLRKAHPAVTPGYHLNKRHWNTVILDGSLADRTIEDMIEDSYDLVVSRLPRARQRALRWEMTGEAEGSDGGSRRL